MICPHKTTQRKSLKKQLGRGEKEAWILCFPTLSFSFLVASPKASFLTFMLFTLLKFHFFTFLVENRIGVSCCSCFFSPISSTSSPAEIHHFMHVSFGLYQSGIVCLDQKAKLLSSIAVLYCFWLLGSLILQHLLVCLNLCSFLVNSLLIITGFIERFSFYGVFIPRFWISLSSPSTRFQLDLRGASCSMFVLC